jgi:hypothetical protein
MPTNTYVALATQTLGSSTSTVTFSSINQGYTDLVLVIANAQNLTGNSDVLMRFNSDSGSNYSATVLTGDGSSASSARRTNSTSVILNYFNFLNSSPATQFNVSIQNYSNATTNKTVLIRSNRAASATEAIVGIWRATPAAITQIDLTLSSSQFAAGSTFSLYGIAAEGTTPAAKATGGTVYADDLYYYHVFGSTGTFTPLASLTADLLVVAGGGGGAGGGGAGGGAGGLLAYSSQSLTATGYTCTVGGGGTGGQSTGVTAGGNSQFAALTASVGGGASGWRTTSGNGGSGGGGVGTNIGTTYSPGTGTSGQGNNGGNATTGSYYTSGGGGGAGADGTAATTGQAGAGGIGATSSLINAIATATGIGELYSSNYYFAGGGGSAGQNVSGSSVYGAGGKGGGGNGATANALLGTNGTIATGGGGGGGWAGSTDTNGGNGGSGVVIVRYLKA